jgi:ribosomal RNA-processing protein 12
MVDANVTAASAHDNPGIHVFISPPEASKNIAFLRTQAESWLAVLFNVFSSAPHDGRGVIGEVISSWISISGEEVCGF